MGKRKLLVDGWYYQVMGDEFGPIQTQRIIELAADGTIQRDTLVQLVESGEVHSWATADSVIPFEELTKAEPNLDEFFNAQSAANDGFFREFSGY